MRAHPRTDHRELADLVVVHEAFEADLALVGGERLQRRRGILLGEREGDIGASGGGSRHVLHDHVDVRTRLGDDLEDLGCLAGHIRDADDGDLGLTEVGGDPRDDGFFHGDSLRSIGTGLARTQDVGALARAERRPGMNEDAVTAGIFDGADVEHLRTIGGELQHLFAGDDIKLSRHRHDARVGGEDPVHVAVDLADVGLEGRCERHSGRVGATAAEGRDVTGVSVEALEAGHDHDGALVESLAESNGSDIDDAGGAVRGIRDHAGLTSGERTRLETHR